MGFLVNKKDQDKSYEKDIENKKQKPKSQRT